MAKGYVTVYICAGCNKPLFKKAVWRWNKPWHPRCAKDEERRIEAMKESLQNDGTTGGL